MADRVKTGGRRPTTTISRKHQVTIPVDAMRAAGLAPGDRIEVVATEDGRVVFRRAGNPFEEFAGALTGAYPPGHLESLRDEWS
ncbi:unnamed protein product [Phaeothamnion confervicola]